MTFRVLGLDLSTCSPGSSTGVAVLEYEDRSIVRAFPITAKGQMLDRVDAIAAQIDNIIRDFDVSDVCIEDVHVQFVKAAIPLATLRGAVFYVCRRRGIDPEWVRPSQVKVHATKWGKSNKVDMLTAAEGRWPDVTFATDDVADAAWVADLGCERIERSVAELEA